MSGYDASPRYLEYLATAGPEGGLEDKVRHCAASLRQAREKLAAIRELHCEQITRTLDEDGNPETYCEACHLGPYPCPTIAILDRTTP